MSAASCGARRLRKLHTVSDRHPAFRVVTCRCGVLVTVIAAAIAGDSVGYEVGRRFGPRILRSRVLDKRRERLDEARHFLARRGGSAVFLARWVAFFRAVMPALAGTARMPYARFLVFNESPRSRPWSWSATPPAPPTLGREEPRPR